MQAQGGGESGGDSKALWNQQRANDARLQNLEKARAALKRKNEQQRQQQPQAHKGFTISDVPQQTVDGYLESQSNRNTYFEDEYHRPAVEEKSFSSTLITVGSTIILSTLVAMGGSMFSQLVSYYTGSGETDSTTYPGAPTRKNGGRSDSPIFHGQSILK